MTSGGTVRDSMLLPSSSALVCTANLTGLEVYMDYIYVYTSQSTLTPRQVVQDR